MREQAESLGATSVEALEKKRSDEFEKLVRAALEKELRYERDPNLKDIAGKRADQIIAAYQSGLALDPHEPDQSQSSNPVDKVTPEGDRGRGVSSDDRTESPRPDLTSRPIYPTSSVSFSLADIIMGSIIILLVIIIILLLI